MNTIRSGVLYLWFALSGFAQWAVENKPYIVMLLTGVEAAFDAAGVPVPKGLYILDAALMGGALHSSNKALTLKGNPVP